MVAMVHGGLWFLCLYAQGCHQNHPPLYQFLQHPVAPVPKVPRSSTWKVGTLKGLEDGGREGLWRESLYSGARPSRPATTFGFLLLF